MSRLHFQNYHQNFRFEFLLISLQIYSIFLTNVFCVSILRCLYPYIHTYSALIQAIGRCSPELRCAVPTRYEEMFEKKLQNVIQSECGNKDFGIALQFLSVDPVEAECDMIDRACKGFGTDELLLLTIICGRTNTEIDLLKVNEKYEYLSLFSMMRRVFGIIFSILPCILFVLSHSLFLSSKFS